MAGAALKLYVHKLIYRISYFLFGVAVGRAEWEGNGCSCLHFKQLPLISSARLCSVQSKQRPQSGVGKNSNNFGLLCCSLLIAAEEAAATQWQIQIKNHAKWTSSWVLSAHCSYAVWAHAQHTQLDTNAANFRVSLDFSRLALLFNSHRNLQEKRRNKKKDANLIVSGKFLLKSWPTTFRSLFMRRYSLSLKSWASKRGARARFG